MVSLGPCCLWLDCANAHGRHHWLCNLDSIAAFQQSVTRPVFVRLHRDGNKCEEVEQNVVVKEAPEQEYRREDVELPIGAANAKNQPRDHYTAQNPAVRQQSQVRIVRLIVGPESRRAKSLPYKRRFFELL